MSDTVSCEYGVLGDTLEEQARQQGYTLGDKADIYERVRKAINMCMFHVATDSQVQAMFGKLHKKVMKSIKPLEVEA